MMKKFIKITQYSCINGDSHYHPVWVNVDHLQFFEEGEDINGHQLTTVNLSTANVFNDAFAVIETPEEILNLINEALK